MTTIGSDNYYINPYAIKVKLGIFSMIYVFIYLFIYSHLKAHPAAIMLFGCSVQKVKNEKEKKADSYNKKHLVKKKVKEIMN